MLASLVALASCGVEDVTETVSNTVDSAVEVTTDTMDAAVEVTTDTMDSAVDMVDGDEAMEDEAMEDEAMEDVVFLYKKSSFIKRTFFCLYRFYVERLFDRISF